MSLTSNQLDTRAVVLAIAALCTGALAQAAPQTFTFPGTTMETPTLFSTPVAEGNHKVTLTFTPSDTPLTIKAETRRVMFIAPKTPATVTLLVNTRTPEYPGGKVKLNERETKTSSWDDKLSLEVLPSAASLKSITIEDAPTVPTVYIAGDSTVCDQGDEPWAGWGQLLPLFLQDVAVANHAESGRALRSFRNEHRLDKILSLLKPGDYFFIQFGHNDQKEKGEGVGAMTTYKADLEKYVEATRAKGATPVIVPSMYRRRFDKDGHLYDTLGDFPAAARLVAKEQNVALIDLHKMSGELFSALGLEGTLKAFVHYPANTFPGQKDELKDDTHFNAYGAYELARCIAEGIRTSNLPLAKKVTELATPFDPSKPDSLDSVHIDPSPPRPTNTPEGS